MNPYAEAQQTVEALANGALQGVAVLALVAVAIRLVPGMNAATRHAVWFTSLLLIAALPAVHGLRQQGLADAGPAPAPAVADPEGDASVEAAPPMAVEPGVTPAEPGPNGEDPRFQVPVWEGPPAVLWTGPAAVPGELEEESWVAVPPAAPGWPAESLPEASDPEPAVIPGETPAGPVRWGVPVSQGIAVALMFGWLIPAGLRLLRLAMEVAQVRRLKQASGPAPGPVRECFETLRTSMGVRRPVVVREGPADTVPFVAGFLHPMVVLPQGYATSHSMDDVVQVLRHELAHVRRGDDWTHLIEQGLRAVLWFHPAVHWITRRLSLEREIACDDHVLDAAHSSRHYALLLTGFAGRRPGRDLLAAPAVWSRKTQLKERIAMILDSKRNSSPRIARAMAGLLMLGTAGMTGLVLEASPQLALVAPPSADADAPPTPPVLVAVSTDLDPTAPPPPVVLAVAVEEGVTEPKVKTVIPGNLPETPEIPEAPEPPEPPVPALAFPPPTPPAALATPMPTPAPRPVRAAANVNVHVDRTADVHVDHSDKEKDKAKNKNKDKDKARSLRADGKDRGSLEERLDRLERMMEKLMSKGGAEWKAHVWAPGTTEFHWGTDPTAMARLAEEAKKAAKEAKAHMPDADMMARIQKDVETAVRDGERTAREAVREAQRAIREQQQAMDQSKERFTRAGKDARAQLDRQRKELEAQQKNLEREMESLERRLERLEEESERLEELEETREDDNRPQEKKAAKSPAKSGASSSAKSSGESSSADTAVKH